MGDTPLLAAGSDDRWAEIAARNRDDRVRRESGETVADRIERGLALSRLANDIRAGVEHARAGRGGPA